MQLYTALALLAAAGAALAQDAFSITTPTTSIIACVPLQLKWQGGQGPYTLAVHTYDGQPGPVVDTAQNLSGTSYTYHPKASETNQKLEFQLTDSTGATAQSGATAAVASNSQCSGSGSGSGGGGASSSSASSGPSSSDSASSSAPKSSDAKSSSESSKPSSGSASSAAPSSSSSSSPAGSLRAPAAVAGAVGLVAAALI